MTNVLTVHLAVFLGIMLFIGSVPFSFADEMVDKGISSPRKQLERGVLPEDVQCRDDNVLVFRDNGRIACVTETTAEKKDWMIITTEFTQEIIIPNHDKVQKSDITTNIKDTGDTIESESINNETVNNDNPNQPIPYIEMNLGSDVEFVDDGREQHVGFQRSPAPMNIYERIIDSQEDNKIDPNGIMRIPSGFVHEKYSVTPGIGLYTADWMPTYIPDGYKLLYFDNNYYEDTTGNALLRIHFVPNTFELTNQTTTSTIQHSGGFAIRVTYTAEGHDEIEDAMEYFREILESDPEYKGRWLDVTRDGKTVWASETQSYYNHYQSGYSFDVNEYLFFGVSSNYMTLEEIEPIFNSVMN